MMQVTRRVFLKGSSVAVATAALGGCGTLKGGGGAYPAVARVAARFRKPGEKLNIGVVGVGGKGWSNWEPMFNMGENIVALCDVDRKPVDKALAIVKEKNPGVKCYSDYRKMFDECRDLDAVLVSTPDHTHAPAAIRAMKQGCHVYVEKPLVRTIWQAHYFDKVAKASGVRTQMGNHGSAGNGLRRNVEVLQAGVLGKVTEVHVWTNRPIWPQGIPKPEGADPIPDTLNWDCWLGTAPERPYKDGTYHNFKWRGFYDFGTGAFGDMACHTMNLPFRGLKLGEVTAAEVVQIDGRSDDTYPSKCIVKMSYAARPGLPPVTLFWYDGNLKPSADMMPQVVATLGSVPNTGCLIVGDKGAMASTNDYGQEAYVALKGEEKMKSTTKHEAAVAVPETLQRCKDGHHAEFVNACKGEGRTFSDVDHSIPLLEGMLVGCIAERLGGKLDWNSKAQQFTGNAAANELIKPYTRAGWEY